MIFNIFVFILFTGLWLAFAAALIFSPGLLDSVWHSFRGLPLIVQIIVGILLLPLVLGLWIWESSWPLWLRLLLVIAIGVWNVFIFFPRQG
jgi:hypothetical protein